MLPHGELDRDAGAWCAPGSVIGSFEVRGELGRGGMGRVLEAYDPTLDRRVAIKVVGGGDAPGSASALVREAQAMARLSHPNVVTVHEVGVVEGRVFIVMELVDGETLARWLERPRTWREVVAMFAGAGAGLHAAHQAGIVHRDFKPANVLVDRDGRPRVGDFGLANVDLGEGVACGSDDAGTPGYIAPEQLIGGRVDARADQYSFAVSLERALAGASGTVPRSVRAAIARARAMRADDRLPSLEPLLAVLRSAQSRRRTLAIGMLGGTAFAASALAFVLGTRGGPACSLGADVIDDVWGADARRSLTARFTAVRPSTQIAIESVMSALDDWSQSWKLERAAACHAETATRPARLACLDRSLHELRSQVAVWRNATGDAVDRALQATLALPRPESCATAAHGGVVDTDLEAQIAVVNAHLRVGAVPLAATEFAKAMPRIERAPAASRAVALLAGGAVAVATGDLDLARQRHSQAAREAGLAHSDELLFEALVGEAGVVIDQGRPLDSLGLLDAAAAIRGRSASASRHDRHDERVSRLRGDALVSAGRTAEGIAELVSTLQRVEARAINDATAIHDVAIVLGSLAAGYNNLAEWEAARVALVRALAIDERRYGPSHSEVAKTLHDLAVNEARMGQHDVALARLSRARDILVATHGERHHMVGSLELSRGQIEVYAGRYDAARTRFETARDIIVASLGELHPHVALIESSIGTIDRETDRCADAIPHFERALEIYRANGAGALDEPTQLTNLAACRLDVGRASEARVPLERALAALTEQSVPDRYKSEQWVLLADVEWREGHPAKAIELANRALAATEGETAPEFEQLRVYVRDELLARWRTVVASRP